MAAHDPAGDGARGAVPRHSHNSVVLPDHRRGGDAGPAPATVGEVHERVERLEIGNGIKVKAASGVGAPTPVDGFEAAGFAEAVHPSAVQRYAMPAAMAASNLAACAETGAVKTDAFGILLEVSGKGALAPAGAFEGAGMADPALRNRALCVHESPMPVQRSSMPLAKADDIVPCAQVGLGKTAALGLPVVSGLLAAATEPFWLLLAPFRELSAQVLSCLKNISLSTVSMVSSAASVTFVGLYMSSLKGSHCFIILKLPQQALSYIKNLHQDAEISATANGRCESGIGHKNAGVGKATGKECPGVVSCQVPTTKSNPDWDQVGNFCKSSVPVMRGSRPCTFLLILLLMLLFMRTEAHLSAEVCPVDQMKSTCPAPFQSKRPDSSIKNWITENYILLPSVGKVERSEKSNINQCPVESWQRTIVQVVGFAANLVINLGPLISCSRITEINTGRRWLLALSSSSMFTAYLFWLIYLWWQNCWDGWRFASAVFSLICNSGYMIFFVVKASHRKCSYIIFCLLSIIVGGASALLLWKGESKVITAGVLGVGLTAFGQLFRMIACGKKWCWKAFSVALWGIVGNGISMFFFEVNWSFETCYKIGSVISLITRSIDLIVLLYYGFMQLFSQAEQVSPSGGTNIGPGHLEPAQTPLLLPSTPGAIAPAQGTMGMPSLPAVQPDGTLAQTPLQPSPTPGAIPPAQGTMGMPSLPAVQPDGTLAQTPLQPSPTPGAIPPAQGTMGMPSLPAVQPDGTVSAPPSIAVPRPSGVVIHPSCTDDAGMPSLPAVQPDGTIPAPPSVAVPRPSGVVIRPSSQQAGCGEAGSRRLFILPLSHSMPRAVPPACRIRKLTARQDHQQQGPREN